MAEALLASLASAAVAATYEALSFARSERALRRKGLRWVFGRRETWLYWLVHYVLANAVFFLNLRLFGGDLPVVGAPQTGAIGAILWGAWAAVLYLVVLAEGRVWAERHDGGRSTYWGPKALFELFGFSNGWTK